MLVATFDNLLYIVAMPDRAYFTYIVASRSHTLYIGVTGNLSKRVFDHKLKTHEGFSATYNCNRLVWFERFSGPKKRDCTRETIKGLDSGERRSH